MSYIFRNFLLQQISRRTSILTSKSVPIISNNCRNAHFQENTNKIEDSPQSFLTHQLTSCKNPNEILSMIDDQKLTYFQMSKAIDCISKFKDANVGGISNLLKDDRFSQFCLNIESEIRSHKSFNVIMLLKNMLNIGLSSESYVVKSLENELLWRIRKMTLRQLSTCLKFHKDYINTDQQREVVSDLIDTIQKRWFEIQEPDDLLRIIRLSNMFQEESIGKIHDRALDLVGDMSTEFLVKLFILLSDMKQRPTPLLRALIYHIKQSDEKISVKKLCSLVYAMHSLNFRDSDFLDRICSDLLPGISGIEKSSVVSAFLTAFGQLQYRNAAVLEQFANWMKNNIDSCRQQDLCSFILALGRLNYRLEEDPKVMNLIIKRLDSEAVPPKVWLDIVWSLAILQLHKHEHLAQILHPDFYRPLIDKNDHSSLLNKKKLLNLNAVAMFDTEGYSGPVLQYEPDIEIVSHKFLNDELVLHKSVLKFLSQIVPYDKGLNTDIMTKMGIHLNAEFIVDKDLVPYSGMQGVEKTHEPLPPDQYRVAVFIWTYRDLTLNTLIPIGIKALSVRILKTLGYKVVEIYYNEVNDRKTSEQQLEFIKQKIKHAVNE